MRVSFFPFWASPLRLTIPSKPSHLKIKIDAMGRESARKTEARTISVVEICSMPRAKEIEGFCGAAEASLRNYQKAPLFFWCDSF